MPTRAADREKEADLCHSRGSGFIALSAKRLDKNLTARRTPSSSGSLPIGTSFSRSIAIEHALARRVKKAVNNRRRSPFACRNPVCPCVWLCTCVRPGGGINILNNQYLGFGADNRCFPPKRHYYTGVINQVLVNCAILIFVKPVCNYTVCGTARTTRRTS